MRKLLSKASARIALERTATFLGVSVIIVFLFVYRGDVLKTASNLESTTIIVIFLTIGAQTAIRSLRDSLLYSALGSAVPLSAIYKIQIKQTLLNHLPLKPGTVYAAISLREQYGVTLSGYASVFLAQSILTFGLALIVASFAFAQAKGFNQIGAVLSIAALGAAAISVLYIPMPQTKQPGNAFIKILKTIHLGMATLSGRSLLFIITITLGIASIFLRGWRIYIILIATGIETGFSTAIIFSVGIYLSLLISVTPAGVGIREGIVAAAAEVLSVSPVAAVVAISLERLFVIVYCAIIFIVERVPRRAL